ncbi:MAG: polysaccharide biosynthesis C-terminal domain-containing protein, partial [Sphingomonadaceae bacterium]
TFVQARLRPTVKAWGPPEPTDLAPLKKAGLPIMATGTLHVFGDTFILALVGVLLSAEDAGAYRIAFQIVTAISIFTVYTESYVSAKIAADYRAGDIERMWQRHRRASLFVTLLASPILIVGIFFPEWLLNLAFGAEFVRAAPVVRVLALAQVVAVVAGPVGRVLLMCGRQDANFVIAIAAISMLISLSLILVPRFGIEGAAYAAAISTIVRTVGSTIYARLFLRPERVA